MAAHNLIALVLKPIRLIGNSEPLQHQPVRLRKPSAVADYVCPAGSFPQTADP
jgi:hypothetical protein